MGQRSSRSAAQIANKKNVGTVRPLILAKSPDASSESSGAKWYKRAPAANAVMRIANPNITAARRESSSTKRIHSSGSCRPKYPNRTRRLRGIGLQNSFGQPTTDGRLGCEMRIQNDCAHTITRATARVLLITEIARAAAQTPLQWQASAPEC